MEYLPYGETWFKEGDDRFAPKYNSQELDRESGYYFYNARHYDPEICRFVTADTVIDGEFDTQGWNRYSYCKNNPIRFKDPTGHELVYEEAIEGSQGENRKFEVYESVNTVNVKKVLKEKEYIGDELARTKTKGKILTAGDKKGLYSVKIRMVENGKDQGMRELSIPLKAGDKIEIDYQNLIKDANMATDEGYFFHNSGIIDKTSKNYEKNALKEKQNAELFFKKEQSKGNSFGIKIISKDKEDNQDRKDRYDSLSKKSWDEITKETDRNIPRMRIDLYQNEPGRN